MAWYVIDPEAVLAFRRNHRQSVQRDRRAKRKRNAEKPKEVPNFPVDREWMAALDRDRS